MFFTKQNFRKHIHLRTKTYVFITQTFFTGTLETVSRRALSFLNPQCHLPCKPTPRPLPSTKNNYKILLSQKYFCYVLCMFCNVFTIGKKIPHKRRISPTVSTKMVRLVRSRPRKQLFFQHIILTFLKSIVHIKTLLRIL